ncbi:MAG: SDR family oxidoreductase [Coriobacteriaceae bacterium]|nr:SDR family oxidoreductase [Coriobacteriaceae bacterium]
MDANSYYKGKVCVVTGAGSGMGKACAELLVAEGAIVYALDIQPVDVEGIERFVQVDLSKKESVDAAFAELPEHIDSFFGVAGVMGSDMPFNVVTCIDLISNKYMMESLLPDRMSEGGSIALVSSGTALTWDAEGNLKYVKPVVDTPGWDEAIAVLDASGINETNAGFAYMFAKYGVNYLVAKMQKFYGRKGIRVNAIMPGGTRTRFGQESGLDVSVVEITDDSGYCGYSMRLADPKEMARPLMFLNSDMASYVSGALVPVDYGTTVEVAAGLRGNPVGNYTMADIFG